jgi:hypothetical protein
MSGCAAALFEPALPGEQTKQIASSARRDNKRMETSSVRREKYADT